jgi:predicted metallopeptidase
MAIRYEHAPDIDARVRHIVEVLGLGHIDCRVVCMRSYGSRARWTLARCHALAKIMQVALNVPMHYVIEIIMGTFDRLSPDDQTKTLIHELLHVPRAFGGGLKSHRYVNRRMVNKLFEQYRRAVAAGEPERRETAG